MAADFPGGPGKGPLPGDPFPPQPGEDLLFSAVTAPQAADRLIDLLDQKVDPQTFVEAYSAFERAFPRAALPGDGQFRAAAILAKQRCRPLAIEAFRKVVRDRPPDDRQAMIARLSLARLLAQSPATFDDARRIVSQVRALSPDSQAMAHVEAVERHIRSVCEEIYPRSPDGKPGVRPSGPCRILTQTDAKTPIPIVGRLLAERLGLRMLDVNIALARSPGILARDLPPETAESLAREIQDAGTPVVVLAEDRCPPLPSAELAVSIRADETGGYRVGVAGKTIRIDPARIGHAQYAALRSSEFTVRSKTRALWAPQMATVGGSGATFSRRVDVRMLCDLYWLDPPRRVRLSEGRLAPTDLAELAPGGSSATFRALIKRILLQANRLPLNPSLDLLFSDGDPFAVTFDLPIALENHAEWLFLLAYNGVE